MGTSDAGTGGPPDVGTPPPACAAGTRRCPDGACRPNDVTACGAECTPCMAPTNASATCDTVRCDFTCTGGGLRCQTQCLAAGACCTADDCPTRENAVASCEGNACKYGCTGEYVACENSCIGLDRPTCCGADRSIDVDGNGVPDCQENMLVNGQFATDLYGWRAEPSVAAARIEWSPMDGRGAAGSGSLKASMIYKDYPRSSGGAGFKRYVKLKGGTTYYIFADYFIPPGQAVPGSANIELDTNNTGFYESVELGRVVGQWTRAKATVKVLSPDRDSLFRIDAVRDSGTAPFVVYFDNVLLRP